MIFLPAPGVDIQEGLAAVNSLLEWDHEQDRVPLMNEPRLYVARNCHQTIWTLENYTGTGGEKAGGKDPADLLRYMAVSDLKHIRPAPRGKESGLWSY
jgi:hypothetical protein